MNYINTPTFKHSELIYASNKTSTEVLLHELGALINSCNSAFAPNEDACFIATRQKINGEFVYTMTGIPLAQKDDVAVEFSDDNNAPQIFFNVKRDVLTILKK